MNSREVIRHPGPPAPEPYSVARGTAHQVSVTLPKGAVLMQAVADAMEAAGCDSGVMVMDGLQMGPFDFVMPGHSNDGVHAAWYSATHSRTSGRIEAGTAIIGKRDGAWWLHCHAVWRSEAGTEIGHLLPDAVTLSADCEVTLIAFSGGAFDVSMNAETLFPIFHPTGGAAQGNALIAKVNPHHDIHQTLTTILQGSGFAHATVYGIGSLIGAVFAEGTPMASPISEVLIAPQARWDGALTLPMICVDPAGDRFSGEISAGTSPVCVTFEVLVLETA
ncbi:hypothetical protein [Donghicola mangrovi]|uniref:DUF296 domain-containing protein n=1 Tax=Donghicola mangrovi TaxID=2729614 RepID=A0A850QF02_9RHOB|nr:hypothetical protein [Donghicola mangrovi]NVO24431.1 hypothetical protein [Donghicola mangrovi]